MTNLFSTQVRFNGGNPQLLKVRYINVTLKCLKDQLNEINQGLNPKDTRRVKYVWYELPMFDEGRISFSRLELTNDDDARSMFLIFCQHNMFPWIDMYVTLLRSSEYILKSLILPEDYVWVASLLCNVFILFEFKFNSYLFAEYVGIEVCYTWCRDLQVSLKSQRMKRTQHVFHQINYICFHIEFPCIR